MHTYVCIGNVYLFIYLYIYFVCLHECTQYICVCSYIYLYRDIFIQHSSDWTTHFSILTFQYETLGKVTNIAFGKIESM